MFLLCCCCRRFFIASLCARCCCCCCCCLCCGAWHRRSPFQAATATATTTIITVHVHQQTHTHTHIYKHTDTHTHTERITRIAQVCRQLKTQTAGKQCKQIYTDIYKDLHSYIYSDIWYMHINRRIKIIMSAWRMCVGVGVYEFTVAQLQPPLSLYKSESLRNAANCNLLLLLWLLLICKTILHAQISPEA